MSHEGAPAGLDRLRGSLEKRLQADKRYSADSAKSHYADSAAEIERLFDNWSDVEAWAQEYAAQSTEPFNVNNYAEAWTAFAQHFGINEKALFDPTQQKARLAEDISALRGSPVNLVIGS